jgi:hypothetical protein
MITSIDMVDIVEATTVATCFIHRLTDNGDLERLYHLEPLLLCAYDLLAGIY